MSAREFLSFFGLGPPSESDIGFTRAETTCFLITKERFDRNTGTLGKS